MRARHEVLGDIRECKDLLGIVNERFNQLEKEISYVRKTEGFSKQYFELIEVRDIVWKNKLIIERTLSELDSELRAIYDSEHYNLKSLSIPYYDDCRLRISKGCIKGIKL